MKYCEPSELPNFGVIEAQLEQEDIDYPVSYTHLTLPTSDLV